MDPNCHTESEPIMNYILEGLVLLALATTTNSPRKYLQMTCYPGTPILPRIVSFSVEQ